ncbi:MAG TPA: YbjN domain-containing protein [Roseiflexaceae bacterium]|nr:YbjN domain-containing protein [Roseiflexaceae bacterium]HMP39334.1 YbjN domain-containing protein [Roseiflexaceae bacterium]
MDTSPNGRIEDFADSEHPNGERAFAHLGQYLADDGWYPQPIEGVKSYRMFYNGKNGEFRCYALVRVELEQFIFYAVSTVKVPEHMRLAAAEYITRANYGLRIGNFEMDFSDGEIRFKSSLDFEGVELSDHLIRNAIYPAVQLLDQYLPGLLKVVFGGVEPHEAIDEIESS